MTTGNRLRAMRASGELQRLARECSTRGEFAARLGMTFSAMKSALERIGCPGFQELAKGGGIVEVANEFDEEEQTKPGVSDCEVSRSRYQHRDLDNGEALVGDVRSDITKPVPVPVLPPGHVLRGASSLVTPDGQIVQQWIKTSAVNDERKDWLEAVRVLGESLPKVEPQPAPEYSDEDTLSAYLVGDPHIGLLAWHEDAGENFDLRIAERSLLGAVGHLIALAPPSSQALLVFIGDNTHSDGQNNTTTKGTRVDVDGRTINMMRTVISTARQSIDLALAKHAHVTMIVERGNHDELLSAMLALALSLIYENEPRVTIDTSPEMYHWFRFGQNLIGTHHGDKAKPMDLLGVMATDRKQDWGETTHRRFYCGHFHHLITKEVPGVVIDYLPTMAGADAWHRSMGYRSARAMYMDVFHREFGHVNRHIVGIQQIRGKVA